MLAALILPFENAGVKMQELAMCAKGLWEGRFAAAR